MPRPAPRPHCLARGLLTACLLGLSAVACTDAATPNGPRIQAARPDPVAPGEVLVLEGEGFGETGHVALGGRPLAASRWSAGTIEVTVPSDQRPGETVVVVVTNGQPSPPAPIEVSGAARPLTDGGRVFPPDRDGGRDGGPPPTDAEPRDRSVPDAEPGVTLVAEYLSDPAASGAIRMQQMEAPAGELVLEVLLPREPASRWGIAFHMAWDRGLMTLVSADPSGTPEGHAAEIAPGRLAAGRLLDGRPTSFRLRFRLLGRGEGRLTFPARYRTLRDRLNRPVPAVFTEGTLSVRAVP